MTRLARLREIPADSSIEVHCPACDRSVPVDAKALGRRYGWQLTLADLQPRMRCKVCGGRGTFRVRSGCAIQ